MDTVVICEDPVHEMILQGIFISLEINSASFQVLPMRGKTQIDKNIKRYAKASISKRIIILRDLDNDAPCAPHFRSKWLNGIDEQTKTDKSFVSRLAVREGEAWLIADKDWCKTYLKIRESDLIKIKPESLSHPKEALLKLIDQGALRPRQKNDFLRRDGGNLHQATAYNDSLKAHMENWSAERARLNSHSLDRAIKAIAKSFELPHVK